MRVFLFSYSKIFFTFACVVSHFEFVDWKTERARNQKIRSERLIKKERRLSIL